MQIHNHAGPLSRAPAFAPIPGLRAWLNSRCEQLSDELQRLIALLDTLDGDSDLEESGDLEPSLSGRAVRAIDGRVIEDAEDDPAELGIADKDALDDPEIYFGSSLAFEGQGQWAARAILRKAGVL